MKRAYQLGITTLVGAQGIVNLLNDKEKIIKDYGEDTYNFLYKRSSNQIREAFGFNYYLAMSLIHPKENDSEELKELAKNHIEVYVFDLEITDETKDFYVTKYDEEKGIWYVEIN